MPSWTRSDPGNSGSFSMAAATPFWSYSSDTTSPPTPNTTCGPVRPLQHEAHVRILQCRSHRVRPQRLSSTARRDSANAEWSGRYRRVRSPRSGLSVESTRRLSEPTDVPIDSFTNVLVNGSGIAVQRTPRGNSDHTGPYSSQGSRPGGAQQSQQLILPAELGQLNGPVPASTTRSDRPPTPVGGTVRHVSASRSRRSGHG